MATSGTGKKISSKERIRARRAELDAERIAQEERENDLAADVADEQELLEQARAEVVERERAIGRKIDALAATMSLPRIAELLELDDKTVRAYRKLHQDHAAGQPPKEAPMGRSSEKDDAPDSADPVGAVDEGEDREAA